MGDTIYSDTEVPGYTLADVALTVKQKWEAYKTNLAMKPWAKARGAAAYYAHWDDHEFINDFSRVRGHLPARRSATVNIDGEQLYKRGVEAFTDYNPITYSKKNGIYRSVRWGKNLEVFFLDERSFRSSSCRLPGRLRQPGRAAATRTSRRPRRRAPATSSRAIAPQLANPPPPECTASINDPNRTMLGVEAADGVQEGGREVERDLQGDLQRGADPAVLRAPVRPLGGLRGRAPGAASLPAATTSRTSSS